ncbi:autotransporter outer membrane beta-barrel domain-containing protein [Neisseriaceae bacterium CLB008]|nr:autotransporter outer membrane beta-barrel domain-containing protein [Neisseriaceae bacterium]
MSLYARASFVREFSSGADYALNQSQQHHSFKGNWWQFGVGVTSQINKRHHVYLDFEHSNGQRFDQRQLNAGYRYRF